MGLGLLGFEYGIVQAPLGPDLSGPELVAAVANAGAIGLLRAPDSDSPDLMRKLIRQTRALTDKPFGVGVVLILPHKENVRAILEEKVAVMLVYCDDYPRELVDEAHNFGVKIMHQVGSTEDAEKAAVAGVDAIIVQGIEAGGHVISKEPLMSLLPRVADLVEDHDIPIIAAGGIVDARGYVAALALGAQGVSLGTRFLATKESNAHPFYKQKLVEEYATEYTNIFGRARFPVPHRVLRTIFLNNLKSLPSDVDDLQQPIIGHTTIYDKEQEHRRFAGTAPNKTTVGDLENMVMYAGQGVGLIKEILPAANVVKSLVEGAQLIIEQ
ncbi:hypothetical protein KI387_001006, partial [Taxus chinensis]